MRYLWYSMYAFVTGLAVYALFFSPGRRQPAHPTPSPVAVVTPTDVPVVDPAVPQGDVQIALLLDTSSSMDGLIEQARVQLWEIVGEMQTDDKDKARTVTVALYQYGNSRLDQSMGFIEKLSDLTPELDAVSVRLYSLHTGGGKEYAPQAILRAVEELAWSDEDSVEKVIVIAGNEGFSQGPVSEDDAMKAAEAKGIRVIPIFCANGGTSTSAISSWRRAASLAHMDLETIDPDKVVAKVDTPYDKEIVLKYQQLEETKVIFGSDHLRDNAYTNQVEATNYAAAAPMAVQAERAIVQSRQVSQGDVVGQRKGAKGVLQSYGGSSSSLPPEYRGKSKNEIAQDIEKKQIKRAELEQEIQELNAKRQSHLKEIPTYRGSSKDSLGGSVRSQLQKNQGAVKSY